ncbi:MAG: hypothetical protein OEZ58_16445 [Gammaproteobacteria bacterium]|nr:hypothetical protein [Gammaproteobacteria bacterium]
MKWKRNYLNSLELDAKQETDSYRNPTQSITKKIESLVGELATTTLYLNKIRQEHQKTKEKLAYIKTELVKLKETNKALTSNKKTVEKEKKQLQKIIQHHEKTS